MDVGIVVGMAGLLIAAMALWLALAPQRVAVRDRAIDRFHKAREFLKDHRADLAEQAAERQRQYRADGALVLLTQVGWIPERPLALNDVSMRLRPVEATESVEPARARLRRTWPRGLKLGSYSAAIETLDRPSIWFNGPSYRLLEVEPMGRPSETSPISLTFCLGRYFDGIDTTAVLGFEEADRRLRRSSIRSTGRYRRWLADPFDLTKRTAAPGVNVLTIRSGSEGTFFFLHRRGSENVAVAMNTTHVAPAGEFQPHADALPVWSSDLDLWRTVMREYAEEFLGVEEASGDLGVTINYAADRPYSRFEKARSEGAVEPTYLGIGLDPLTWKPEVCLVCRWEAPVFDDVFGSMLDRNDEGVLIVGPRHGTGFRGLEFTSSNVLGYAARADTLPAARACLTLAWRWRRELKLVNTADP